jgi:hypothetical protein
MFQSRSRYCEAFFSKTMQLIAAYHREPAIAPIKQSSRAATLRDRLTYLAEPLSEGKAGAAYQPVRQATVRDVVSRINAPDPIIRMGSLSWTVSPAADPAMLTDIVPRPLFSSKHTTQAEYHAAMLDEEASLSRFH